MILLILAKEQKKTHEIIASLESQILGAMNSLSELEKRKRKDNTIKDIKTLFGLRKEVDNSATKDIRIFLD